MESNGLEQIGCIGRLGSAVRPQPLAAFAFLVDLWEDSAAERAGLEQDMVREAEAMLREVGD
jgi:hypothetical protein